MLNYNGNKGKPFIPVLMYHEVTDNPERNKKVRIIDPAYSLNSQKFEEQVKYLYDNGYHTISPEQIRDSVTGSNNEIMITFDDGLIGNYEHAFPILRKYGFTATIFLTVDWVAATEQFLTWDHLGEMSQNGIMIQSHTLTHPALGSLSEDKLRFELSESKKRIEEMLNNQVKYISLPFGSCQEDVFRIAGETGYAGVFTSSPFDLDLSSSPYRIGRIPIKDSHSLNSFRRMITRAPGASFIMDTSSKTKNGIKKIIGLDNYRRIYRFFKRVKIQ